MTERPLLEGAPEPGSRNDTVADKVVRFAIGFALTSLALTSLALGGVGEGVGLFALFGSCFIGAALGGLLSITHGERFVEQLGRLVKWLP